jgi:hypothetical protein
MMGSKFVKLGAGAFALALGTMPPAFAQGLTPFQRQALSGTKKTLVQQQHANCRRTSQRACDLTRVEILGRC